MNQSAIFEVMFKHATIGILISNSQGDILMANNFAEKLFGYENQELNGRKIEALVPDKLKNVHVRHRENFHKKPVERTMGAGLDLYGKRKDGTTFPIEISLGHTELDGEKLAIAYVNDVTNQKKVQNQNRDISKIVEDSLNEIFIFDAVSLQFVLVNAGGRNNIGYSQAELSKMTPLDIKPTFTQASFAALIQPLLGREKEKIIFETIHQRKNGTTYPVEIHLQYASFDNQPVFVAIISDITERKEHEQKLVEYSSNLEKKVAERTIELEESQNKLSYAQAIAKIGHWDWWAKEKKLILSKGMYQILDFDEDKDYTYEQFIQCFHPDDAQAIRDRIERVNFQDSDNLSNFRIITPKNNLKILHSNLQQPIYDESGAVIRLFGVMKDVTAQKNAEKLLQESLKKERELGELKSRFVSMASHEFRTPLSSILSSAELIEMYVEANKLEKIEKNTHRIKSSVRNLTGILNDFLSLEKLEAGKVNVVAKKIFLPDFLEELKEEIKPILQPQQQLLTHFENQTLHTDPYLLKNILLNLISNAIKYSSNGENVKLTFSQTANQLTIKVIDKGIGIPEADQAHMFTRFFRASNVEAIKGTGLGLTIVRRYLDLMQGTIEFESELGKGSVFIVRMPVGGS